MSDADTAQASPEPFELTVEDEVAIDAAKKVVRNFLRSESIASQDVVGLGKALYALERLPDITSGVTVRFGINYTSGNEEAREYRYIDFCVSEDSFEIKTGGSVYDKSVGSDSFSEPGWLIEAGGYRDVKMGFSTLVELEDLVLEYLNLGAEIEVQDENEDLERMA